MKAETNRRATVLCGKLVIGPLTAVLLVGPLLRPAFAKDHSAAKKRIAEKWVGKKKLSKTEI